jgi:hypothetical protein
MYAPYNKYFNEDTKLAFFVYKKKVYDSGTKFIFTGPCILNEKEVFLSQAVMTYMYGKGSYEYFKDDDNNIYMCNLSSFKNYIIDIVKEKEEGNISPQTTQTEFYWTDGDVVKTLWYIIIMLFATIFHERVGIWILATAVWGCSIFNKKK